MTTLVTVTEVPKPQPLGETKNAYLCGGFDNHHGWIT